MPMSMVFIRIVRMPVPQWLVRVHMRMRLRLAILRIVAMLMMNTVEAAERRLGGP